MDTQLMKPVSAHFEDWKAKLPKPARDALEAKIAALETDPTIAHGSRNADYAKRTKLREFAEQAHGYRAER